jgi:membrane associated rhomboid family serine protease
MFPYRDDNPTLAAPIVTLVLIGANVLAWMLVQGAGTDPALTRSVCHLGLVPGELLGRVPPGTEIPLGRYLCPVGGAPAPHTALTSMFLHGSWLHMLGNVWFLWIFGNNVEDSMGRGRFVAFYLLCGLAAAAAQVAVNPGSPVPMVGASGAISGVMGAYLMLYPRVRVHLFVFLGFIVTTFAVPAYFMLLYWMLLQGIGSAADFARGGEGGGVAYMAHMGGFVAGLALIKLFARRNLVEAHRKYVRNLQRPRVAQRDFGRDRWF